MDPSPPAQRIRWIVPPKQFAHLCSPFVKATFLQKVDASHSLFQLQVPNQKELQVTIQNSCFFPTAQYEDCCDMTQMKILNQAEILQNLVRRFSLQKIFTFIGKTLIVINPYQHIEALFNSRLLDDIVQHLRSPSEQSQRKMVSQPHTFSFAAQIYQRLIAIKGSNQSIIISGQSGAGKTETTKHCLKVLTALTGSRSAQGSEVNDRIIACNPIFQVFGNAKTIKNDNSSRFGKYLRLLMDEEGGSCGAEVKCFLLQKSRVVSFGEGEKTFHAFYLLLAGQKQQKYSFSQIEKKIFLDSSHPKSKLSQSFEVSFEEVNRALADVGFLEEQNTLIWDCLAAIIKLLSLQFNDEERRSDESKSCTIVNLGDSLELASQLLGLGLSGKQNLTKLLLYERKTLLKETVYSPYSKQACKANLNTLCKAIYNEVFQYILRRINHSLKPKDDQHSPYKSINILDIFGFEDFHQNGLEQVCINFANEKLLQLYNKEIFQTEMALFRKDGLEDYIANIAPPNNEAILDAFSGKMSIFSIVNDLTLPPQFQDLDMVEGFRSRLKGNCIISYDKIKKGLFKIEHSHAQITYDIQDFKKKNQDRVTEQIQEVTRSMLSFHSSCSPLTLESNYQSVNCGKQNKTVINKFTSQIQQLVDELSSCEVHFIRCLKPNQQKQPQTVDQKFLLNQVRYLGIFQTIQLRKNCFPIRMPFDHFTKNYRCLLVKDKRTKEHDGIHKRVEALMRGVTKNNNYLIGRERVYFDEETGDVLDKMVSKTIALHTTNAIKIQKAYRKHLLLKNILQKLKLMSMRIRSFKSLPRMLLKYTLTVGFNKILYMAEHMKKVLKNKPKIDQFILLIQKMKARRIKNCLKISLQSIKQSILYEKEMKQKKQVDKENLMRDEQLKQRYETGRTKFEPETHRTYASDYTSKGDYDSIAGQAQVNQEKPYKRYPLEKENGSSLSAVNKEELTLLEEQQEGKSMKISRKPSDQQSSFLLGRYYQSSKQINDKSQECVFLGNISLERVELSQNPYLRKLKSILSDGKEYVEEPIEYSSASQDCTFTINNIPSEDFDKIIMFPVGQFMEKVLRKRTTFFGYIKSYEEVLVYKNYPISRSMTLMSSEDDKKAIEIFNLLLKICKENYLNETFALINQFLSLLKTVSEELVNQAFLQIFRQLNTHYDLCKTRMYQVLSVLLHAYCPDEDFMLAGLNIFVQRLNGGGLNQIQSETLCYLVKRMLRKIEDPQYMSYFPIKYHLKALMYRKKISIIVSFPIGRSIVINVESFECFSDIKERVLRKFGVDVYRFSKEYFTFFEIINFENDSIEETPIDEYSSIWDLLSYWEVVKQSFDAQGVKHNLNLMIKVKYAFACYKKDEEAVQICYAQCFYDYLIGRIRLDAVSMVELAALTNILKKNEVKNNSEFIQVPFQDEEHPQGQPKQEASRSQLIFSPPLSLKYNFYLPQWVVKLYPELLLQENIRSSMARLHKEELTPMDIKYRFVKICSSCPLAMAMGIPTNQGIKLFLRPKWIILSLNSEVQEEYAIKQLGKWSCDREKFSFQFLDKSGKLENRTHAIFTQYSSIITHYLSKMSQLKGKLEVRGGSSKGMLMAPPTSSKTMP